jgi:death on curing protein
VIYLTYADLLYVAERAMGERPVVRDAGLLEAAAARPRATVFGRDAYPTLEDKAAALTHSIARNHALVDGNKRLALGGLIAFLGVNGRRLTLTNDLAYDLIIAISTGELSDIPDIADRIRAATNSRHR